MRRTARCHESGVSLKRMNVQTIALWLGCCLAACAPDIDDEPSTESTATPELGVATQSLFRERTRVLNFIAHQDDDIFAMNHDLINTVRGLPNDPAAEVHSIVFTNGENTPGCIEYARERDEGQWRAWEVMAQIPPQGDWIRQDLPLGGKMLRSFSMPTRPNLGIVQLEFHNNADKDLEGLWNRSKTTISTFPESPQVLAQNYRREELIAVLVALLDKYQPTHVNIMDATKNWGIDFPSEHTDHVHGALFAMTALQRSQIPRPTVRMFRTYNATEEGENVAEVDRARWETLYDAYAPHDKFLCQGIGEDICGDFFVCNDPAHLVYGEFNSRMYPMSVTSKVTGPLRAPSNQCLRAMGAQVATGPCTTPDTWSLLADGTLKHVAQNKCVSAGPAILGDSATGSPLTLVNCNAAEPRQRFFLNGLTQLRGVDASCVSAENPNQLTLADCANVANQRGFNIQFSNTAPANSIDFTVAKLPATLARSLTYGDLNGDGLDDVCFKRAGGVTCAFNTGNNTFGAPIERAIFTDNAGFAELDKRSTLQIGRLTTTVSGLCARHATGMFCAGYDRQLQQFTTPTKRTWSTDFSNSDGWFGYGSDPTYWGSIRMVDIDNVNGDDICGRNAEGIECALNNGAGSFARATQWIDSEFNNYVLWNNITVGTTVQFGDIDGDGWKDVCGRGADGIICALHKPPAAYDGPSVSGFERPHMWSNTGDFSDDAAADWDSSPARYRSIRLGDINGDGRADVCGRAASGVVCAISMGQSFEQSKPMLPIDIFTDGNGYGTEAYGASLALIRLNGDSHRDLCVRGKTTLNGTTIGLVCATAP